MSLEFHKMHGAGNDFVLIDARGRSFELGADAAARIADRHAGVGCDQILLLRDAREPGCAARYEVRNADGSAAGQCGNGARCVGLYLQRRGEAPGPSLALESPAGVVALRRCDDGEYEVAMGVPDFRPERVPARLDGSGPQYALASPWGELTFGAASMGNPHAVLRVDDIGDPRIPEIGAWLGRQPAFPEGCNVGFAHIESPSRIRLRVVERGAGETLACGSGACAAVAVLQSAGAVGDEVEVLLPGGRLVIKWRGNNQPVSMKGPAAYVFRGTLDE